MADLRSRKTGDHNPQIVKLMMEAAAMREQIDGLEARVLRLEAEIASTRAKPAVARPASRRPAAMGPPPLPKMMPSMPPKAVGGRRSVVDISEIAELVESVPPPAPSRPRK